MLTSIVVQAACYGYAGLLLVMAVRWLKWHGKHRRRLYHMRQDVLWNCLYGWSIAFCAFLCTSVTIDAMPRFWL